jgi:hypothetical protein
MSNPALFGLVLVTIGNGAACSVVLSMPIRALLSRRQARSKGQSAKYDDYEVWPMNGLTHCGTGLFRKKLTD